MCRRDELVGGGRVARLDMEHRVAEREQRVGDQPAMTLPPERLGTHDRCPARVGDIEQLRERVRELARLHVVRVSAKRGDAPAAVDRILARGSATAERRHPVVVDGMRRQQCRERLAREMRVSSRGWEATNVGHDRDLVGLQNGYEVIGRPRGVADGPNSGAQNSRFFISLKKCVRSMS